MSSYRMGKLVLAATLMASAGAGAQSSRLYVTAGDNGLNSVLQGGAVVQQFSQQSNEYAIAVYGDVRTLYNGNPGNRGVGAQYTLGGTFTGTTYAYPVGAALFYDGTTDGNYNYSVDYGSGDVWRMDRNWASASLLSGEALLVTAVYLRFIRRASPARLAMDLTPHRCAVSLRF